MINFKQKPVLVWLTMAGLHLELSEVIINPMQFQLLYKISYRAEYFLGCLYIFSTSCVYDYH